jgi:hypothetical protein
MKLSNKIGYEFPLPLCLLSVAGNRRSRLDGDVGEI